MHEEYRKCMLCQRKCGVDREIGELGFCGMTKDTVIARAALHKWEEPSISGSKGSGTIFFVGCSLGCTYCQNSKISRGQGGWTVTDGELADTMLDLEKQGAHNVNLVTPTHFTPSIRSAIRIAKEKGLTVPVVYNTGSYDTVENLKSLKGLVDIYLPDLKYYLPKTAKAYSLAEDYVTAARSAIEEMFSQTGRLIIGDDGIMRRGTVVRVLLLPGHLAEAKLSVKYLYSTYGDNVYLSLMSQYTPKASLPSPLNRRVTSSEYLELVDYAVKLGVKNAYIQESESASESFIPEFK